MRTLTQIQALLRKPENLTSNDILNFAPETLSESLILNELVETLKNEIRNDLISNINFKLR